MTGAREGGAPHFLFQFREKDYARTAVAPCLFSLNGNTRDAAAGECHAPIGIFSEQKRHSFDLSLSLRSIRLRSKRIPRPSAGQSGNVRFFSPLLSAPWWMLAHLLGAQIRPHKSSWRKEEIFGDGKEARGPLHFLFVVIASLPEKERGRVVIIIRKMEGERGKWNSHSPFTP